jgi:hypothetical protein
MVEENEMSDLGPSADIVDQSVTDAI